MADLPGLGEAIEAGDRDGAVALTAAAIAEGVTPQAILDAMTDAMDAVGEDFQANLIFVPEMLVAARAMRESMALLEPILVKAGIEPEARAVIGTVRGDMHDIGKNLVAMMWRGANIEVIDLGTNVTAEQFVAAVETHRPDLVGLSALLTTTMPSMGAIVGALRQTELRGARIIVGGAPVNAEFAERIGADAYAGDAGAAVVVARRLLGLDGGAGRRARDRGGGVMTMSGRDRVLAAINHEEPDRVPIVIGASNATGMKVAPYRGLKALLGVDGEDRYIYDWPELGTILPDEAVLERLHADVRGVFDAFPAETIARNRARSAAQPVHRRLGERAGRDRGRDLVSGGPPDGRCDDDRCHRTLPVARHGRPVARGPRPRRGGAPRRATGSTRSWPRRGCCSRSSAPSRCRGSSTFLMNLAVEPDFAEALLRKIAERCKVLMGHFLDELGDNVDMIKIGDDLGTEQSLLMSPAMYRRILKPIHADYIAFIRQRTKAKVFFHTDGDVFDLLDDFVEIGVDILNPVQSGSGKLGNLAEVKRRYGTRLAFCGAIDTQHVLPTGTPDEVRAEVRRAIGTLGPGGGYLLAAVHTIMNEVPPENVLAMADAAVEFGSYPIRG